MSTYGYRRGSIFWALALIAVGGLFLYQNFNPTVHPWQIIAKFWPVLIIFWGLSKLIDYLQAQAHPETVAPRLFSASEVILLLLILALGTMVSKIILHPWHQWAGITGDGEFGDLFLNPYTYTQTISQASKPQPHVIVVDRRGDVEIRSSDQPMLEAVVKKVIRAENEEAARKIADQLNFEFVDQAGRWVLQSNLESVSAGRAGEGLGVVVSRSVRLDIVLRVPKAASVEITTERGDIVLDGLRGDQTLTARSGDVRVANVEGVVRVHKSGGSTEIRAIKGSAEVEGRGGDIEISNVSGTATVNGDFSGSIQFRDVLQSVRFNSSRTNLTAQKLTGRLNMEMGSVDATGIEGPFEISTRQKDISLHDFRHAVKIANTNGDVRLGTAVAPSHPIEVDLKKGEIELSLPTKSSFEIQASSRHGEVECNFPSLKVSQEGEAPSISGTYGKGGPTIHLTTAYGAIRLLRQSAGPAPSPAPTPSGTGKGEKQTTRRLRLRKAVPV